MILRWWCSCKVILTKSKNSARESHFKRRQSDELWAFLRSHALHLNAIINCVSLWDVWSPTHPHSVWLCSGRLGSCKIQQSIDRHVSQGRIKFYYGISPSLSSRTKSYEILSFNHHHLHPHAIRQLGAFVLHSLCRCSLSASPPCPHRSSSRSSKVSNPLARFFVHSLTSEEGEDDKGVGGWKMSS